MESYYLSNSNNSLESHSSIRYKNKLYNSASHALEDYIKDFDRSLVSPEIRPGKICMNQSTPREFKFSEDCFQKRYALENFKQHRIKVSGSPSLRRKTTCDPDTLSLTTDDLLAFPADGSVSFNQVGTLWPAHKDSKLKQKSRKSVCYVGHQTSSFAIEEEGGFPEELVISSSYKDFSRKVPTEHTFHKYDSDVSEHPMQNCFTKQKDLGPVSRKNYPRWLTSQKSDLSVSGISSIPDFKYPAWLDSHNLLSDSGSGIFPQTRDVESSSSCLQGSKKKISSQNLGRSNNSKHSEFNGLLDLENKDTFLRNHQCYCPRVCFAPDGSGEGRQSCRENDPKARLLKVKSTLESSADELGSFLNHDGSPCTVDILEAERSWDNIPIGLKSPVPVCCEDNSQLTHKASMVDGFLEDCLKTGSEESTFSGGNHHGPVEALKLMLFNLQAVQESFNLTKTDEQKEELKKALDQDIDLRKCDSDTIPVTKSIERALHHLSRLKGLVGDTCDKEELKDHRKS